MIQTMSDLMEMKQEIEFSSIFMYIIPSEGKDVHPVESLASVLMIKNLESDKTYYFSIHHPDLAAEIEFKVVLQEILATRAIIYVYDLKAFRQMCPEGILDRHIIFDLNLITYLKDNKIVDSSDFDTPVHDVLERGHREHYTINNAIPLSIHLIAFENFAKYVREAVLGFKADNAFADFQCNNLKVLGDVEKYGLHVNPSLFQERYQALPNKDALVFTQYNPYTATGRPSNRFGGVNYAALNKDDGTRKCFTSRFGSEGKMIMMDYSAFFPRIICNLTGYEIPIEQDIYEYLAMSYFDIERPNEYDAELAKQITFTQLFGGVNDKYKHIKYLSRLQEYIEEKWKFFKRNGYVRTPYFNRKITDKHIKDPNPTKVFNYILQATEGEVALPSLSKVIRYLEGKSTKPVLYTYDSILLDVYYGDGRNIIPDIMQIMRDGNKYHVKTYIGDSYDSLRPIKV